MSLYISKLDKEIIRVIQLELFLNIYLLFYIFETKSDIFYVRIIHFIHDKTGFTNKSIEVPNYGTRNDTINLFLMKKIINCPLKKRE